MNHINMWFVRDQKIQPPAGKILPAFFILLFLPLISHFPLLIPNSYWEL